MDSRLFREDVRGSREWARALHSAGHLAAENHKAIQDGLNKVESELAAELATKGRLTDTEEDIHSVVERRLGNYAGEAAKRLHTGRSRNDQSATDTRLWMLDAFSKLQTSLRELIAVLVDRSKNELGIIIPGYTHLQRAQPVRWSHFLLSHAWALYDDSNRLQEQWPRLSRCPLGSGAIAGCAFTIDRKQLAKQLGFIDYTPNSMFAVSTRDHVVEFLNWASLTGTHLSRLAEDLIIYGSQEFGIVCLSDQFSTGSSLMPQKRNPDGLELVRGAAGLFLGDAFAFSCTLKGLPSTYNKDLQCDKELLFRSFDRLIDCLKVTTGTISTLKVDGPRALSLLDASMLATDVAHALVRRGVAFRQAHHAVGACLKRAQALNVTLQTLSYEEFSKICPELGKKDIENIFSWEASVEQYKTVGGTARSAVEDQIIALQKWLQSSRDIKC